LGECIDESPGDEIMKLKKVLKTAALVPFIVAAAAKKVKDYIQRPAGKKTAAATTAPRTKAATKAKAGAKSRGRKAARKGARKATPAAAHAKK
jgi:hypothetical protein